MSTSSDKRNCIVIIFDDQYFDFARNCLKSFSNFPDHPMIKVIYQGNDTNISKFIDELDNTERIDINLDMSKLSNLNLGHIGSPMIYVRYVIWSSLFDDYDKVLYIDCDSLIIKPFPELFEHDDFFTLYDNADKPLFNESAYKNEEFITKTQEDNLPHDLLNRMMINSGVLLVPKRYRTAENFRLLNELSQRYSKFIEHSDQSIITIWCYLNDIKISCDYRYNFMIDRITRPSFSNIKLEDAKLLHFSYWKPNKNIGELFQRGPMFRQLKALIEQNSDFFK
ncbi:hypothetical protein JMN32_05470 [Fulvivirga sp. 29W222]|uniref:Glycosyl transferase n=1 Tax=Fulvivirga marina TaxID=2494733 RepID=A0A937FVK4_9BACT|nr:glycosyltransferase [Fulvivirga marina]MBL6445747.1 hypothetical protein [Fulvivirga marina]